MLRNNGRHNFRSPFNIQPSLTLDFAGTQSLDSKITFTRSTIATYFNSSGVLVNSAIDTPRFSFNPATLESLGLLREPQSTNLILNSQDFTNASWNGGVPCVRTANTTTSPDGTSNGSTITSTNATYGGFIRFYVVYTAIPYTASIYVKKGNWSYFGVRIAGSISGNLVPFVNLDTLAVNNNGVSGANISIVAAKDGWYRISLTYTPTAGASVTDFGMVDSNGNQSTNLGAGQYTYIYGSQLETLGFSTSYIKTAASSVTRSADLAIMTGSNFSSWYNQSQGTIYCEGNPMALNGPTGNPMTFIVISDTTINNEIRLSSNLTNGGIFESATSGVSQFALGSAVTPNTFTKMAGAYSLNNTSFSKAGGAVTTDTSCTIPTVSQMEIGSLLTGRDFSGNIKKIVYYPQPLTSNQLQALTT